MGKWNSYNWHEFEVTKLDKYPKDHHYIVLVFTSYSEYQEGWHGERGSYSDVPCTKVYAFTKKDHMELMVTELTKSETKFVFYEVAKLGKVTVTVDVETET